MKREEEVARRRAGLSEAKKAMLAERLQRSLPQEPLSVSIEKRESDQQMVCLKQTELDRLKAKHPQMEDIYPLTPLQQGMLFHTLHKPASGVYIGQLVFTFRDLNQQKWGAAWQQVIAQHAILRTAFEWQNLAEPLQLAESRVDCPMITLDWRDHATEQQECDLSLFLQEDRLRGFDLAQAPLMRLTFIHVACGPGSSGTRTLVVWSYHQILIDGWSIELLLHDVFTCYLALMQDEIPQLPPRRLYRDYLAWLLERPDNGEEAYWRGYLAGFRSPTPLLLDHRTAVPSLRSEDLGYGTEILSLPAATYASLQEAARRYQITLNILVLGAWALVLSHYSGEQDVVFGAVVSGRPPQLEGVESMIGLFINTLPVRVRVPPEQRIQNWLVQLQGEQAKHRAYEQSPLVQVQNWSEIPHDRSLGQAHRLLFESLFLFENHPLEAGMREQGHLLQIERVQTNSQTNYPLSIFVEIEDELRLRVNYESQRFEAATIQRVLLHLRTVLEQLADLPDLHLADISLLTKEEHEQLHAFACGASSSLRTETEQGPAPQGGIHTLFEAQVEQTPDTIAVVYEGEMLTYGELNRRANQLACYLRMRGVKPEVRVGILLERSLWLPIVLLGVLKAGGTYVPLDPALPPTRLTLIAQDACPTLLVTSEQQNRHSAIATGTILLVEQLWQSIKDEDAHNLATLKVPVSGIAPSNLAYIVYTSGSTGRPKGILSTHAGAVNYLRFVTDAYQLTSDIVVLQLPPLSFDASVRDIFATWIVGGRLVLMKEHPAGRDLRSLVTRLQQQGITALLSIVPSFLHTLLDTVDSMQETCPLVSLVLSSGERLSMNVVDHARRVFATNLQVINQYGPTEATMTSTYYEVEPTLAEKAASDTNYALIGKPIANMQAYVLDRSLRLVPVGVVGEVYLAGSGLARGYLDQADATAEKFIPNPFVETSREPHLVPIVPCQSGTRMYRTGDLACYRPDGILEYHGRRDQQVKVRGNRVELEEIRVALEEYPGVSQAIVIAHEAPQVADMQLIGYIVPKQGQTLHVSDLRPFLQARLSEYMLPAHFIVLEAIPLTPNGKLDRRALPLPQAVIPQVEAEAGPAAPSSELSPLQAQVASIWADMLHQPQVNIHDDFFELGGHSLLALQLMNRIRTTFAVDLPLDTLFETPTVEQMALVIAEMQHDVVVGQESAGRELLTAVDRDKPQPSHAPTIPDGHRLQPMERPTDLPLSFAQERLWFLDRWEGASAWYNVPMALRFCDTPLEVSALESSLATVVQRHEALRTTFEERLGDPVQIITLCGASPGVGSGPTSTVQIPVIDLRGLACTPRDRLVSELARTEAQRPFDLTKGPLLRMYLLRLAAQEHVLLFTLHHIVTDGWSMGVLAREMTTLYQAYINKEPIKLHELPIQYADYTLWQRKFLQGEVLDSHIAYWKRQLAGAPVQLTLPTDRPRPAVQTSDGARLSRLLPLELQQQLRALSQREGVTLFMAGLSVFNVLLNYYTGQDDLVVGTDVANRNQVEIEHLIGFFVNQLILRTNLTGNPSFLAVMHRVRKVCLEAYAHQDLPFDHLVRALNLERDLSHTPLFQVKFVLQDVPIQDLQATFTVKPLELERGTAKFDLLLNMSESHDGLFLWLDYRTALFDVETMTQFLQQFEYVMRQVVAFPDVRLENIQQALAAADREEQALRKQKLQLLSLETLEQIRRDRNLKKPRVKRREEIS